MLKNIVQKMVWKYRDALKCKDLLASYKSGSGMPTSMETQIGVDYESTKLGALTKGL